VKGKEQSRLYLLSEVSTGREISARKAAHGIRCHHISTRESLCLLELHAWRAPTSVTEKAFAWGPGQYSVQAANNVFVQTLNLSGMGSILLDKERESRRH